MNLHIPLYLKIVVPFILILTLTVGISGYEIYRESTSRWQEEMDTRLQRVAQSVAVNVDVDALYQVSEPLDVDGPAYERVQQQLDQAVSAAGLGWLGIYYRDGDRLFYWVGSDFTGVGYPFFYATDAHFAAFTDFGVHRVAYTDEFGTYYGFVVPILVEDESGTRAIGIVEASLDEEARQLLRSSTLNRVLPVLAIGIAGGIAFFVLSTIFLFLRPLQHLKNGALAISEGRFDHVIPLNSHDELGDLAVIFNRMSAELSLLYSRLQEYNRELEARVAARTSELLGERNRLKIILQNVADGLVVTNPWGIIELVNPILAQIAGVEQERLPGTALDAVFPVPELTRLVEQSHDYPEKIFTTNISWKTPGNGASSRVYKVLACALVEHSVDEGRAGEDAETLGVVTIFHDITHEIEVDRMKTDFLSMVSHELRTPLTSVLGFAKLVRKTLEQSLLPMLPPLEGRDRRSVRRVRDNLDIIVSEGERLTRLINDVLDVAKIEAGKVEWHVTEVEVEPIAQTAISTMTSMAHEKGLSLRVSVAPALPTIKADPDRLIQVVTNLLSNAIKFTDQGEIGLEVTHFTLEEDGTTTPSRAFTGQLRGLPSGQWIAVSVRDTGLGMSPEDLGKIFEKFKQVGNSMTNRPRGTGLGLAICKEIVEYHGGRIWAKSELGAGSVFTLVLPTETNVPLLPEPESAPVREAVAAAETTAQRILVVDDEANIRKLLQQELSAAGYEVLQAADGVAALQLARQAHPDLVILDVMMPGITGFDVITALRSDEGIAHIPVAILSVLEDRSQGFRLGADAYLTKPLDVDLLLSTISRLLKRAARGEGYKKVLVIDENNSTVETISRIFETKGYKIVEAENGAVGVQKALEERPYFIILDAVISKMNNYEVLRTLKYTHQVKESYLIVISRAGSPEEMAEFLKQGADFYSTFDHLEDWEREQ